MSETSENLEQNIESFQNLAIKQLPPENCHVNYDECINDIDQFNAEAIVVTENDKNTNSPVNCSQWTMAEKLEKAAPYNYFFTKIESSPQTHNEPLSISFEEILDPSLGELESSVQFTFLADMEWTVEKYKKAGCAGTPLLILWQNELVYGRDEIFEENPHIKNEYVVAKRYAHAKVMLLAYTDNSMRVVVSTANFCREDWINRAQGVWISPRLGGMSDVSDATGGESPTGFRGDLITFLSWFKNSDLETWIKRARMTDFSAVNVFLITSLPGQYSGSWHNGYPHGHPRVAWLLAQHAAPSTAPIVAQSSAVGNFTTGNWLNDEFIESFRLHRESGNQLSKIPEFRFIFPTMSNVFDSYGGIMKGGECLPYSNKIHRGQKWIVRTMCEWKADCTHRTKATPHIKTYARWTDNKLHWFILTSANMSWGAWGGFSRFDKNIFEIVNVEAGVLFLPKFVVGQDYFPLDNSDPSIPAFPMIYDIPLVPYKNQEPYRPDHISEYLNIPKIIDGIEYVLDIETGDYVLNTQKP